MNINLLDKKGIVFEEVLFTRNEILLLKVLLEFRKNNMKYETAKILEIMYGVQSWKKVSFTYDYNSLRQIMYKVNKKMKKHNLGSITRSNERLFMNFEVTDMEALLAKL